MREGGEVEREKEIKSVRAKERKVERDENNDKGRKR